MEQTLTQQQIFDKVVVHLHTQNEQAVSETGACVYRGDNGLMCAVGCLITDEAFNPEFNNVSVRDVAVLKMLKESGVVGAVSSEFFGDDTILFLEKLQNTHDGYDYARGGFNDVVRARLKYIAEQFNLSTETLDKLPLNPKH